MNTLATWNTNRETFALSSIRTYEEGTDRLGYAIKRVGEQLETAANRRDAGEIETYLDEARGYLAAAKLRLSMLASEYEETSYWMDEMEAKQQLRNSLNRIQEYAGLAAERLERAQLEADWLKLDAPIYLQVEENAKRLERLTARFGFKVSEDIRAA